MGDADLINGTEPRVTRGTRSGLWFRHEQWLCNLFSINGFSQSESRTMVIK